MDALGTIEATLHNTDITLELKKILNNRNISYPPRYGAAKALGTIIQARTKQQIDTEMRKVIDEYPQMQEREKVLKQEVQQLQQERNRAQQERDQAQGERDRLQRQLRDIQRQLTNALQERNQAREERDRLQSQLRAEEQRQTAEAQDSQEKFRVQSYQERKQQGNY